MPAQQRGRGDQKDRPPLAGQYGWTEAEFHDASGATIFSVPIVDSYEVNGTLKAVVIVGVLVTAWVVLHPLLC